VWSRYRTRWLPLIGTAFVLLGVLMILLGWRGASTTPLVFEQLPYLISGGQLGAALVTLGGLVYFSYWLTVLVGDQRETHRLLGELLAQAQADRAPSERTAQVALLLVATAKGDMAHLPDCPVVKDRKDLRSLSPDGAGRKLCGICHPLPLASGS
jgi:hypothetical protein